MDKKWRTKIDKNKKKAVDSGSSRNDLSCFNREIFIYHAFGNQDTRVIYTPSHQAC